MFRNVEYFFTQSFIYIYFSVGRQFIHNLKTMCVFSIFIFVFVFLHTLLFFSFDSQKFFFLVCLFVSFIFFSVPYFHLGKVTDFMLLLLFARKQIVEYYINSSSLYKTIITTSKVNESWYFISLHTTPIDHTPTFFKEMTVVFQYDGFSVKELSQTVI